MRRSLSERLHGHLWTFFPYAASVVRPPRVVSGDPFEATVEDPQYGALTLRGELIRRDPARLVVILHGLGGSSDSRYVIDAANTAADLGLSALRANMRGADRSGEDVYHAGLADDVRAILSSPALSGYSHIYLLGFSMGGHILLRWATEPGRDPRVRALAAVCSPLDLSFGAFEIQRPMGRPYQWHVLRGLKESYAAIAGRRPTPVPVDEALAISTILEWDERIVVPRFGFDSRAHYYASMSAGPRLDRVGVPSLFVAAENDPIVSAAQVRHWLVRPNQPVEVAWTTRGGHVAFPRDLRLVGEHPGHVDAQILAWLLQRGG
ncbi:MAG: YheT family hydrolase [Sandaracinaceae bacterium]